MSANMKRRAFISLLGGAAAAWPLSARAQQSMPVIGFLVAGTPLSHGQWVAAFVQRLRELGWIEGRTIAIGARLARGLALLQTIEQLPKRLAPQRWMLRMLSNTISADTGDRKFAHVVGPKLGAHNPTEIVEQVHRFLDHTG